jgi:hypothetical protein
LLSERVRLVPLPPSVRLAVLLAKPTRGSSSVMLMVALLVPIV